MAEDSRGWLFRKRTILGGALLAGIGMGIYIGKFEGFGLGRGFVGEEGGKNAQPQATTSTTATEQTPAEIGDAPDKKFAGKVVRVLIDDRQFLLRDDGQDLPMTLPKLIDLVKHAPGDDDGIRIKIYEKMTARVSAEEELKKALIEAGIPDTAIYWVPAAQTR